MAVRAELAAAPGANHMPLTSKCGIATKREIRGFHCDVCENDRGKAFILPGHNFFRIFFETKVCLCCTHVRTPTYSSAWRDFQEISWDVGEAAGLCWTAREGRLLQWCCSCSRSAGATPGPEENEPALHQGTRCTATQHCSDCTRPTALQQRMLMICTAHLSIQRQ